MYWERHRVVVVSMAISVLLHILLLSGSHLWLSKQEKERMFRVRLVPPMHVLIPRPFRAFGLKPAGPEVEMEMLRRGGGPVYIPEIPLPPGVALGDLESDMEIMLMPKADMLSFQPGSKSAEFLMERAEMIPPAELGIPREKPFEFRGDLLTLDDLDRSGRFKAVVVIDAKKKQNVQGYVHIPRIEKRAFTDDPAFDYPPGVHVSFATYMNRHTGIKLSIDGAVEVRSSELLNVPILFFSSDSLKTIEGVDKQDVEFLGEYVRKGGFIVIRSPRVYFQLMVYLYKTYGSRFSAFVLPPEHPIFHSFYDLGKWSFVGIRFEGRLVGIAPMQAPTDDLGIREKWINIIVFAMAQPEGLTYAMLREPETSSPREPKTVSHLALVWRTHWSGLDSRRLSVSIDERKPISLGSFSEGSRYDGIIFHNLPSGKHRLRLRYGERTIDKEVVLRGGKITTLEISSRRIFWVTNLYLKESSEESYDEWQARLTDLALIDSREISLSQ